MNTYKVQMYEYPDSELFDSYEDTGLEQIVCASIFESYVSKYLTSDGLYYMLENYHEIVLGITGDGLNVIYDIINKYIPAEVDTFLLKKSLYKAMNFHNFMIYYVNNNRKLNFIKESQIKRLLQLLSSKIFNIFDYEPDYSKIENVYLFMKENGYAGELHE